MLQVDINYLAVLIAALVPMATGYLWYSKWLFAKEWMKLAKVSEADTKKNASQAMMMAFVASLITSYVLAYFMQYARAETITDGLVTGFWAGLGFAATTIVTHDGFEGRPQKLTFLNIGYTVVTLMLMGAVLAALQ